MRNPRILLLVAALAGCATAHFTKSDVSYTPTRARQAPKVFFDAPPAKPYRVVGMVSAVLDADSSHEDIERAVLGAGQDAGCDVLVERGLHESRSRQGMLEGVPLILVHEGGGAEHEPRAVRPTRQFDFVCGVSGDPAPPTTHA